jgi:hypothetical protein
VQARGFQLFQEKDVEVKAEMQRDVTLLIGINECGPCVTPDIPEIPLERQAVAAELPLIPMQQFVPPAKPIRRRPHWF